MKIKNAAGLFILPLLDGESQDWLRMRANEAVIADPAGGVERHALAYKQKEKEMANEMILRKTALPIGTFAEMQRAGELLGQCRMLGCSNPAEGFIVAATCYQEGMTFLDFTNKFDIIEGRPRKKAETMLAELRQRGGNYVIRERSPEVVTVEFTYGKNTYVSSLQWKEIEFEPYTRAGKDEMGRLYPPTMPLEKRRFKDNWSTPRRRMQMMWARCVSDGVRVVCPEVTQGMYTPEEAQDFDTSSQPIAVPTTVPAPVTCEQPMPAPAQISAPMPTMAMPVVEAPAVEAGEAAPTVSVAAPVIAAPIPNEVVTPFDISAAVEQSEPQEEFSPFTSGEAKGSVCHVKGQYMGYSWHLVPVGYCQTILAAASVDGVTDEDREFIKESLKQRGVL